jgi:hypothetical protein
VDQQGRVLGLLTFVAQDADESGAVVQGFNFVIPVEAVRAFLDGSGVRLDEPSRFNTAWHAALRSFFSGAYPEAAGPLEEVQRLFPGLPDVTRVAAETREKIMNPPPRSFPWAALAAGVAALGVGTSAALLAARWRRNRFRIRASEVIRLVDSDRPPVILDVRDDATYGRSPFRIPNALHLSPEVLAAGAQDLSLDRTRTVVAYCT